MSKPFSKRPRKSDSAASGLSLSCRLLRCRSFLHRCANATAWLPCLLSGILFAFLCVPILSRLVLDWYHIDDFSHGFLIPVFVAVLLWNNRKTLFRLDMRPTWQGFFVVLPSLFFLVAGQLGAGRLLSRLSLILLCAGIIWTLGGLLLLKHTRSMLLVCLLALPLPGDIYSRITLPLQLLASEVVSKLLPLAGVPVFRSGNIIQLPTLQLEVAQACSGIRSLMSLLTVSIIFGYLVERTPWKRFLLAVSSIPIAIICNVIRIFLTGLCVQYWDPSKAEGFFHEFSGGVMFLVSLCCLLASHAMMSAGKNRMATA